MLKLSVLIPVYNSEKSIGLLCEDLLALYSDKYRLEIVLVNDHSSDDTDRVCKGLHSAHKEHITYIALSKNFGEHNALIAGLRHVTGEYCVMMDDDLQNPPMEVGRLMEEILKGYDVVYANYAEKKDSIFRNLCSRFNDKVANVILDKPSGLYLASFKVINRFLIDEIIKHDGPDPYIDGIILQLTDNIGRLEVLHREREFNRSGYTFKKLVSLWGSMVVNFSMLPIRLVGICGGILVVFGLMYGAYKTYDDYHSFGRLTEYESLMSFNLVFRGIILLAIGIIGEYVGRIYLLLNKSPQFVIRSVLNAKTSHPERMDNLKPFGKRSAQRVS